MMFSSKTVPVSARVGAAAVLCAASLATISPGPAAGSAGFGDVPAATFYTEAVQWMVDNAITTGTGDGCFSPDDTVTRGQAAAFMWRMEGEPAAAAHGFGDVSASWQQDAVSWMSATGVTTGTSIATYSPDEFLTRGQLAALLWRLAGRPTATDHGFGDVFASWQQDAVSWMSETGITTGFNDAEFRPDIPVTRGQLAAFFYRYSGSPTVAVDPSSDGCGSAGGAFSDEFDGGAVNLLTGGASDWTVYNGSSADRIDIDSSAAGALVVVPSLGYHNGWYAQNEGPYVYQTVSGDFSAAIRLTVVSVDDPTGTTPPGTSYNSGGFVVRDGAQPYDWVMFNIGTQSSSVGYGREVKTTVDGSSVLNLTSISDTTYRLLVCRVGSEIRYFYGPGSESGWTAETIEHTRADFGTELQVGIAATAWNGGPRAWVEVERIHFGTPSSLADCTSSVAGV